MDTIGLDLHKRESQVCILGAEGAVQELRIVTTRERLSAVFGQRPAVGRRAAPSAPVKR
jgi:hypothetical protein